MTICVNFYVLQHWYSKYVLGKPYFRPGAQLPFGCLDLEAVGGLRHALKCYKMVLFRAQVTPSYVVEATKSLRSDAQLAVPPSAVEYTSFILVMLLKHSPELGHVGAQFYLITIDLR